MSDDLELFPAWRQAVKTLVESGITFGSTVTRAEIVELCRIKPAQSITDVQRFNLDVLSCVSEIKETLLTAHSMLLVSDRSGGYVVVHPRDQTRFAVDAGMKAISREMKRMAMATTFVRSDLLTADELSKNADAQAKISRLADMISPVKRELRAIGVDAPAKN